MPKIVRSPDCGHSPKNQLLEDLAIARLTNDAATLDGVLSEQVEWTVVGKPTVSGKESVLAATSTNHQAGIVAVTILHVTQHGRIGAVNGHLKIRGGKLIHFCDVCEFASAKGTAVANITSYVVRTE